MSYGNAIALIIQSLDSSLSGQLIDRDLRLFATRNRDLEIAPTNQTVALRNV